MLFINKWYNLLSNNSDKRGNIQIMEFEKDNLDKFDLSFVDGHGVTSVKYFEETTPTR